MSYRVLIPTAGTGSRLGPLTQYINKSLVGIANRPTISHVIEQFPSDVEFVITLGHKGYLVKEFLNLAYPDRKFFFAEVNPFEGPESGLGLSVISCKEYLQQPFVFISCDTLVREVIPSLDYNWMGYAELDSFEQYRTIEVCSGTIKSINEKGIGKSDSYKPYIGLAGIKDYKSFWLSMENGGKEAIAIGESYGLQSLISNGIHSHCFTWFDTGNPDSLALTRKAFKEPNEPNILEKANEAIWFIDDKVIKFSDDRTFIANRVKRAKEIKNFVPEVTTATPNMYAYAKANGEVLSKVITLPLFEKLLQHSKGFWQSKALSESESIDFRKACLLFYKNKTEDRIDLFYKNFGKQDGIEKINGKEVPKLEKLLDAIDWNWMADGLPGRFHGDFHFENILYAQKDQEFVFLDWRQEFGGSLTTGDIYYDFAKLLHGLIISHELIAENHFWIDWQTDEIRFDFHRKQILVECEQYFSKWLDDNGYDRKKVWMLTALVYLNIAALHHYPYSLLLYGLGKQMLFKTIK